MMQSRKPWLHDVLLITGPYWTYTSTYIMAEAFTHIVQDTWPGTGKKMKNLIPNAYWRKTYDAWKNFCKNNPEEARCVTEQPFQSPNIPHLTPCFLSILRSITPHPNIEDRLAEATVFVSRKGLGRGERVTEGELSLFSHGGLNVFSGWLGVSAENVFF